jgi:hypothetical protein
MASVVASSLGFSRTKSSITGIPNRKHQRVASAILARRRAIFNPVYVARETHVTPRIVYVDEIWSRWEAGIG